MFESVGHDDGHDHDHNHDHGHGFALPTGLPRYALALILAFGAESVSFFAPHTLTFSGLGMALSAVAIGLAGFSTYVKGLAALRNLRLNINALMTVAVTGALIGFALGAALIGAVLTGAVWASSSARRW